MKIAGFNKLGILPLQDHREILPEHREAVRAARIIDRDPFGGFVLQGHEGNDSPIPTLGDLLGGFHWPQRSTAERQMGAWFFASAALTTAKSEKPKKKKDNGGTRTRKNTKDDDAPRQVKCGLIGDQAWKLDARFSEQVVSLPPGTPDLPAKTPILVLTTTNEGQQELLGIPMQSSQLIAVNNAGDPEAASLVYDLTDEDEPDPDRKAKLHSFFHVVPISAEEGALAWQLKTADQDGIAGYGYVIDTPGAASAGPPAPPPEDEQPGENKEGQFGRVTLVSDYLRDLAERLRGKKANESQLRDPLDSVGTTPSGSGGPIPADPDDPNGNALGSIVASVTARRGGFCEVGQHGDVHEIGKTLDGGPINAAHIHCAALFKNDIGDGPLDFEVQAYEEPAVGGPFTTPVHLRWDAATPHEWSGGVGPGKWRWVAESFFFVPEDRKTTKPPYGSSRPPPPPPPPPPWDPPKDCQVTPGGTRTRGGRTPLTGSGGTGMSGLSSYGGGNSSGAGGIYANTGADTWTPPTSYPPGTGPSDAGSASGTGSEVDGPGSLPFGPGGPISPDDGDRPLNPGEGTEDGEGDREKQKGGGGTRERKRHGSVPGGLGTFGPTVPNIRFAALVKNSTSIFGGGSLPAHTHLALVSQGVLNAYGRPTAVPPPRVGDTTQERRERGGGVPKRTPTALQTVAFGGGIKLDAYATAGGQTDFTNGGWIQEELSVAANGGTVAGLTAFGIGDGTWESITQPETSVVAGGVVFGPPEFTDPVVLHDLLSGAFNPGETRSGTVGAGSVDFFMPGGGASLVFGAPGFDAPQGDGNVRLSHTAAGLEFDVLTSTGASSGTSVVIGEGGVSITGPLHATGKVTFDDMIDPTGIAFAEQASRPSNWPQPSGGVYLPGLYAGNTAGANEAWWVRDDGTAVDLSTTGGGGTTPEGTTVRKTGAQSISSATVTTLTWDAEVVDDDGWHDNVTNNSRITVTDAGWYVVSANVEWSTNLTGRRFLGLYVNGTGVRSVRAPAVNGDTTNQAISSPMKLSASDYVEVKVLQTSGSNVNAGGSGEANSSFTVMLA